MSRSFLLFTYGFFAGDSRSPGNPIGDNGPVIHNWMYKQKAFWKNINMEDGEEYGTDSKLIDNVFARTGSYIMGKRMFEEGEVHWAEELYKAGLVDEFFIHITPLFLGSGIRLFDGIDKDKYDIQIDEEMRTTTA